MTEQKFISFEDLWKKRRKWVEANRENGFEAGIKRLLTELYPDNAHFIYELLQNAEDAGATEVCFSMNPTGLDFEHNGTCLFSLLDVESITSIGVSTKRDDPTSIGKFGVGFKAVFAYTNTPGIHSGEFHFRIHDLVVPEKEGVNRPSMGKGETRFVFPFNHPNKPPATAVEEVEKGLRALGDNTLLFLSHIRKIKYRLPDGSAGYMERLDHEGGRIEIRTCHPGGDDTVSHWLRFQKHVEVAGEEGTPKTCRIAIAYSLVKEEDRGRSRWRIVPLNHGQVSIYFPAEKETSNLRFHLHAPFASTVARDSVRDCPANNQLRDHLAELVVESLNVIRKQKLLTVNFLGVMPIPVDGLSNFYEPIRKAVVTAFQNEKLTPTKSKTHAPAHSLYRGPAKISEVLDDDDLSLITQYNPPLWAANPPQQNQREDQFLKSLQIDEWGWSELVSSLKMPHSFAWAAEKVEENREHAARIENWVAQKDDDWLMRFYALLGEACGTPHYERVEVSNLHIVRVETSRGDDHVTPDKAFFPPVEGTVPPSDLRIVKEAVYSAGRSDTQKKYAESFLEHIGVKPFDAREAMKIKLTKHYKSPPSNVETSYFNEILEFIAYWRKNPNERDIFRNHTFLLGVANDEKLHWSKPSGLCLDAPYIETGLAVTTHIHEKYAVWHGYQDGLNEEQIEDFVDFLIDIGSMYKLEVIQLEKDAARKNPYLPPGFRSANWTRTGCATDYSIHGLDLYLTDKTVPTSRLLWEALIRADARTKTATFKPNQQYRYCTVESQLVYHLKQHSWIPDKSGEFRMPQDLMKDDLRTDFPYDDRNGLLTAIGFGEHARPRSDEYNSLNHTAQEIGFESFEVAEEIARLMRQGLTIVELRAMVAKKATPAEGSAAPIIDFGEELENAFNKKGLSKFGEEHTERLEHGADGQVKDPRRRSGKLESQYVDNIRNEPSQEERRKETEWVLLEGPNESVRTSLSEWYNGKCQVCGETWPKRDGNPFFVAAYLIERQHARWLDEPGNAACLCAEHFAQWRHAAIETPDVKVTEQIRSLRLKAEGGDGNLSIHFKMLDKECTMSFDERHLLALRKFLEVAGKG